ncbi:MAG: zinc ABC transporter ATP-binding protein [Chlamydiales bacterium 38-26]|nr:metal ABC transporter ATP-binding protein [Chlamydiales bacterium]OJV11547.1 MAG: zinc ABC transporter ATP-binding protein [Chlamydiales bacterium 38-26]
MNPIIQLKHVYFSYAETPVLTDVDLAINAKEFIGIIGPNGGGKTTLLKLLMGFLKPSSGKIEIFGTAPDQSLNHIAYVPQTQRYDREFPISVLELVLAGRLSKLPWYGKFSKEDKEAAMNALERVKLAEFYNRPFGTLSGGQAQRALIARSLASEPQLLLLDEPTANVDSQAEADIYEILHSLRDKMSILMVTHDLSIALEQVQRVLLVQNTVMPLKTEEVCQHFAMGLYHGPLVQIQRTI